MSTLPFLPGELPEPTPERAAQAPGRGTPRLRRPQRDQVEYGWSSLDERLDPDSQARVVWELVCRLDVDAWLVEIKAVEGHVGRDATDPRLLVALWVFATLKGIGSARELERLCKDYLPYQWLCGGVSVNYHMLADFRSQGGEKWDELLTQMVATLMDEGLVTMNLVAQDGMRVRANAGKSSFRSGSRLEELLAEAQQQVEALKHLAEADPEELTNRQQAARERAAAERQARIEEAGVVRGIADQEGSKREGKKGEIVRGAGVDHGPRGPQHEVQRRRLPPRVQRAVCDRHGDGHRGGGGRDQRRHRQRRNAADA